MKLAALSLAARVAATDCEAIHRGLVRQPVNTYSSLGFIAVGLWIVFRAARREPGVRAEPAAFGSGIVIVGLGSVLLHGPAPGWALWLHDLGVLAVLLLVAVLNLGLLFGWRFRRGLLVFAAGLVLLGLELAALPPSTVPIAWGLAPVAGLSEVAIVRSRRRRSVYPGSSARNIAWLVAAVAVGLAGAAYLLGRSGSSLCHPESLIQLHAVWHVLAAISTGAFAYTAFEHEARIERAPRPPVVARLA